MKERSKDKRFEKIIIRATQKPSWLTSGFWFLKSFIPIVYCNSNINNISKVEVDEFNFRVDHSISRFYNEICYLLEKSRKSDTCNTTNINLTLCALDNYSIYKVTLIRVAYSCT